MSDPIVVVTCPLCPWGIKTGFEDGHGRFADHMKAHGDKAKRFFEEKENTKLYLETADELWNWAYDDTGDYAEGV